MGIWGYRVVLLFLLLACSSQPEQNSEILIQEQKVADPKIYPTVTPIPPTSDPNPSPTPSPTLQPTPSPTPTVPITPLPSASIPPSNPPQPEWVNCEEDRTILNNDFAKPIFLLNFDDAIATEKIVKVKGDYELVPGISHQAFWLKKGGLAKFKWPELMGLHQGTMSFWLGSHNYWGRKGAEQKILDANVLSSDVQWVFRVEKAPLQNALQFYASSHELATGNDVMRVRSEDFTPGTWQHWAITWDSKEIRFYINGVLQQTLAKQNKYFDLAKIPDEFYLLSSNRSPSKPQLSQGNFYLDEFSLYDEPMTPTDIQRLMGAQLAALGPEIKSGNLLLQLWGSTYGYALQSIMDLRDKKIMVQNTSGSWWKLKFTKKQNNQVENLTLTDRAFAKADLGCQINNTNHQVKLSWNNIVLPGYSSVATQETVDVAMTLQPNAEQNAIATFLTVNNHSTEWSLEAAGLAWSGIKTVLHANTDRLLYPGPSIGKYYTNPYYGNWLSSVAKWEDLASLDRYPSRFLNMQWLGLYSTELKKSGIYLAVEDVQQKVKSLIVSPHGKQEMDNEQMDIEWVFYPNNLLNPGNDLPTTTPIVFALQDGDWFDFAKTYRAFLEKNKFDKKFPYAAEKNRSHWSDELGFFQTATILDSIKILTADNNQSYKTFWHYNSWQAASGLQINDLPNAPFSSHFAENLDWSLDHSIYVGLYTLATKWDRYLDASSVLGTGEQYWESQHGQSAVLVDKDLKYQDEKLSIIKDTNYYVHQSVMCPLTTLWKNQLLKQTAQILATKNVAAIYMDELGTVNLEFCRSTEHEHEAGSTTSYIDGFKNIIVAMRNLASKFNQPLLLYSEGFSEAYPMDAYLVNYWPTQEYLPLGPAIYHDWVQFWGRENNVKYETQDAIMAMQLEAFVWGILPGYVVEGLQLNNPKSIVLRDYFKKMAALRWQFRDFLAKGTMLRPPQLSYVSGSNPSKKLTPVTNASTITIPDMKMARNENNANQVYLNIAEVSGSAWRNAKNEYGIVLAANVALAKNVYVSIPWDTISSSAVTQYKVEMISSKYPANVITISKGKNIIVNMTAKEIILLRIHP